MDYRIAAYSEKNNNYFSHARRDAIDLIPFHVSSVLEVGCGAGATLALIKNKGLCGWTGGVEIDPSAAEEARQHLDFLVEGDFEQLQLEIDDDSLDLIMCLDVIEHMVDPWLAVRRLKSLLKPEGLFIMSIPNVRNHSVLVPLLFKGDWQYEDAGIMDKTHLRFFTRKTAIELLVSAGFEVELIYDKPKIVGGRLIQLFRKISMALMPSFFSYQYIIRAVKKSA